MIGLENCIDGRVNRHRVADVHFTHRALTDGAGRTSAFL